MRVHMPVQAAKMAVGTSPLVSIEETVLESCRDRDAAFLVRRTTSSRLAAWT